MSDNKKFPGIFWVKTSVGTAESLVPKLVKERARRNLLLMIDGNKSEEELLANLKGITIDDFHALRELRMIGRVDEAGAEVQSDYSKFTSVLTRLIADNLGLRGFFLTLAVDKASNDEELEELAKKVLALIRVKKGDAVTRAAHKELYGF